jgi:transcriptional regulator with XRE-family HTH domain
VTFGRAVRKKRNALGLTLEQLAERANLTPNFIGTVENGQRDPSLSTVLALAKGLRTPVSELLGPVKDISADAVELGRLFDSQPADVREAFLRVFRALAHRRR